MSLASLNKLQLRAEMLAQTRHFFAERAITEVDPCALRAAPAIDTHIQPIATPHGYLHTSPEYAMKILLAEGSGDIFYLGHVYRAEEEGPQHHPEFTMAEWYRRGFSLEQMIEETLAFATLFVGPHPVLKRTYRSLFNEFPTDPEEQDRLLIDAEFATGCFTIVTDYPAARAANAKLINGIPQRFELYFGDVELANGYHELTDAAEQEHRMRAAAPHLPLDRDYLAALPHLPDCCGVAVGFDRLLMLQSGSDHIREVLR